MAQRVGIDRGKTFPESKQGRLEAETVYGLGVPETRASQKT